MDGFAQRCSSFREEFRCVPDGAEVEMDRIDKSPPKSWALMVSAPRNRFVAMILLAIWLVASQHCALEAADFFPGHGDAQTGTGCCTPQANGCESDGCKAIESGQYRSESQVVKAGAPDLSACLCLLCASLVPVTVESDGMLAVRGRVDEAPTWVPSWQFERRAAAPAHAPDALIA